MNSNFKSLILVFAISCSFAGALAADSTTLTKSLNSVYPGYSVTLAIKGFPPHQRGEIVSYQPINASDSDLLERAITYAKALFLESDCDSMSIQFYDQGDKNKYACVRVSASDLQNMARSNSSRIFRPVVVRTVVDARLADGPLKDERNALLKQIQALQAKGVNVQSCSAAFWQLENCVRLRRPEQELIDGPLLRDSSGKVDPMSTFKIGRPGGYVHLKSMVESLEKKSSLMAIPKAHDLLNPAQASIQQSPSASPGNLQRASTSGYSPNDNAYRPFVPRTSKNGSAYVSPYEEKRRQIEAQRRAPLSNTSTMDYLKSLHVPVQRDASIVPAKVKIQDYK